MIKEGKLALLEEMLDLEEGSLNENMELGDIDAWDSMAVISLIALADEHFGKSLTAVQIKKFKTIKDILDFLD